ncbi:putative bifunctional diguanylate cyclase/phosphodiesterase [Actinoplanes nipponensis]|uniref:putative bifunctional diguanylate cyclase/phosphodiesterase n=1 Tax=Actinoplanes nipponensis TaxID=135950 RepID=UPI001944742E|nr:bifunctional diguanylate cyclase/phosphodiesterase [Actinoplanes nipponensis]
MAAARGTSGGHRRPAPSRTRTLPAWGWFLLAGGIVTVLAGRAGATGREVGYATLSLSVIGAVIAGVRTYRPAHPLGWWVLAAGMGCGAAAHLRWVMAPPTAVLNSGISWTDAVYFSMYLLVAAAVAILSAPDRRGAVLAGMAEAGIVACTAVVLVWVFMLDPFVNDGDDWSTTAGVLVYPVLDLLIITTAMRLRVVTRALSRAQQLIVLALLAVLAADIAYIVSVMNGGPWAGSAFSAFGWLTFLLLLGAAALHPSMAREPGADPGRRPAGAGRWTVAGLFAVVLIGPAATCFDLVKDILEGELDVLDVVVPLGATTMTAVLLVARLIRASALVQRRAAELQEAVDHQAVLQGEMSHLALHDPLTGLPNRLYLDRELREHLRRGDPGCLLLLDVDGFKHINESLGHPIGDALLVAVAQRLRETVGPGALLARLGGDEFAVLLPDAEAATVARRCADILAGVRLPADIHGHRLHVTISIGVRRLAGPAAGTDALSDADLALYEAKAAGRDRAVTYDAGLRERQLERTELIERLRDALTAGQFSVYYQPIVSLGAGGFDAVEALVRWFPAPGEVIGPDRFIPAAEDSGLIVALGEWVLRQACRDAAGWHRQHGTAVTVNVSPRQLMEPDYAMTVRRALRDAGLPPTALILEITEGMLVGAANQDDRTIAHLSALRREGVRVAVDDFGTGYSSLAYLRDLPIDILKIDRSFLPDGAGPADRQVSFVRTIVDLAHNLGLAAVAEGVETPAQVDLLRGLGCDKGQGFHFGRPVGAAETTEVLAASRTAGAVPIGA